MNPIERFELQAEALAFVEQLREKGIESRVKAESEQDGIMGRTVYYVFVSEEDARVLYPDVPDEMPGCDESLMACPQCKSPNTQQRDSGCLAVLLFVPLVIEMIQRRRLGVPYRCRACRHEFRISLRSWKSEASTGAERTSCDRTGRVE